MSLDDQDDVPMKLLTRPKCPKWRQIMVVFFYMDPKTLKKNIAKTLQAIDKLTFHPGLCAGFEGNTIHGFALYPPLFFKQFSCFKYSLDLKTWMLEIKYTNPT